jgi:preprotein translocase YajC subunit
MYNMIIMMAQNPQATGSTGQAQTNPIMQFLPFILIFVVMWFFMIRPQSKKQKELQQMLESVKPGDWVLTNGGIIGNNHIRVEFQKSAIVTILNRDDKAATV